MFLTVQKPTRSSRKGETVEAWRGSDVWHVCREVHKNLGYPIGSCVVNTGRPTQPNEGRLMAYRESDQPIVLRGRESRLHELILNGEGVDDDTQPRKETLPGLQGRIYNANLPVGNSKVVPAIRDHS